jgi:hypothetical protein
MGMFSRGWADNRGQIFCLDCCLKWKPTKVSEITAEDVANKYLFLWTNILYAQGQTDRHVFVLVSDTATDPMSAFRANKSTTRALIMKGNVSRKEGPHIEALLNFADRNRLVLNK